METIKFDLSKRGGRFKILNATTDKTVKLDFGKSGNYEIYLLDQEHTNDLVATTDDLTFTMKNQTCFLIKEV